MHSSLNPFVYLNYSQRYTLGLTKYFLWLSCLLPFISFGQTTPNNWQSIPFDTVNYQFYNIDDIFTKYSFEDTLADIRLLQKVTLWNAEDHYVNTGNYGSALFPILFSAPSATGFNVGMDVYSLYQVRPESFKFYSPDAPVSDLFFSQLGTQDNLMAQADFSRGFTNGLSMSLNYKRLSYGGQYRGADTKSTGLGVAVRYESPNKRHNSIFYFSQNANEEGHTGGVFNDADVQSNNFRRSVPTRLANASSRHQQQTYSWHQYLQLTSQSQENSKIYLLNIVKFQPSYYKFSDRAIDSTQFSDFYAFTNDIDTRGIRRYLDVAHWSEGIFIHAEKKQGISGRVGLTYDNFTILDGLSRTVRNDLTASFDGYIPVFKTLFINTQARIGLLENIGNFDLKGQLDIKLSHWLTLSGKVQIFRTEPSYISQNLIVNDVQVLSGTFNKPIGSVFGADLKIPKLKLTLGLSQSLIDQQIYFDSQGLPQQSSTLFTLSRVFATHQLKWGILGFDNQVYLQNQPNKILPLPEVYSSHQLYFAGRWFKKVMDVNIGLDMRMLGDYVGPGFHPLFMNFHLTDQRLSNVPAINAFFMAKVGQFRALLMMDNVSQYFMEKTNYHIVGHPQFDPLFRISIRWLMVD